MKSFIYKNMVTGETKKPIQALSFELADEYFECTYWYTGEDWKTIEV